MEVKININDKLIKKVKREISKRGVDVSIGNEGYLDTAVPKSFWNRINGGKK